MIGFTMNGTNTSYLLLIYKDISIASFAIALILLGYLAGERCAQNAHFFCFKTLWIIFLWLVGSALAGIFWWMIPPSVALGKFIKHSKGEQHGMDGTNRP